MRTILIAGLASAFALPANAQGVSALEAPSTSPEPVSAVDASALPRASELAPPQSVVVPSAPPPVAPEPPPSKAPEKKAKTPDMVETAGGAVGGVLGSTAGAVGGPLGSAAAGMVGNRVGRGTVGVLRKIFGGKKKKDEPRDLQASTSAGPAPVAPSPEVTATPTATVNASPGDEPPIQAVQAGG